MASYLWSWIFIIQLMLARPGYAHVSGPNYEVLARRALRNVFMYVFFSKILHLSPIFLLSRGFSEEEKSRNTFTALAIAAGVVLVVLLFGLFIIIRRQRQQKVPELEAAVGDAKPSWWMVDGKSEKINWWRLSHRIEPAIPPVESQPERRPPGDQSRIERLKAALQIQKKGGKSESILPTHRKVKNSPTETIILPFQTSPKIEPRYPDVLERGYQIPIYPAQSPPQITTTLYGSDSKPLQRTPSIPPQAIVTQGQRTTLSRSGARSGAPRSPAGSRRRESLNRNSFRHPFLPVKVPDAPLAPKISAPVPIAIDLTNPKLGHPLSFSRPRAAPSPPRSSFRSAVTPKLTRKSPPPAPLELRGEVLLTGRKVRFGLPSSPRPRNNASPVV